MNRFLRYSLGFIGALLLLTFLVFPFLLNSDKVKQQLTVRISEASGLQAELVGDLSIGYLNGVQLVLHELQLGQDEDIVLSIGKLTLSLDLLPLLHLEARINQVDLQDLVLSLARTADGTFTISQPATYTGVLPTLNLARITLTNGILRYTNAQTMSETEALGCKLDARDISLEDSARVGVLANLSLHAELACTEVRKNGFVLSELNLSAEASTGVLTLDPVTMTVFDAIGTGTLQADMVDEQPRYTLDYALPGFNIEAFFNALGPQQAAAGTMDFSAALAFEGKTLEQITQSLSGQVLLRGEQLILNGVDLDAEFASYESSQNFNLVDLGAFFFAGPLGLVVTKGYDFAKVLTGSGIRSDIQSLVSDWSLMEGVAQAQDVALVTTANRLALKGALDFNQQQFNNVTFALLEANGCARVEQVIQGTFTSPAIGKPSILRTLAGPVLSLLREGFERLTDRECEIFYTGSLAPPL